MNAPVVTPPSLLRRAFKWGAALLLPLAISVVFAPALVSWSPALRDMLIRRLVGNLKADVAVDSVSVGWFSNLRIVGLRVTSPSGEPLVTADRIESDRTLWQMLAETADLGVFRVERPTVSLALRKGGSNFDDAFGGLAATETTKPAPMLELGGELRIVDGAFRCRSDQHANPWSLEGLNVGVGWRPAGRSKSGRPELFVERGTLLDHCELSIGLCEDLLKFVAPVLAEVARVKGQVTIEFDDWRLPWGDFAAGELGGRVTMHTVDAGPGVLVQSILELPVLNMLAQQYPIPKFVELARESTVPFAMREGHIHHEHLKFSLAGLVDIETGGYVGLDQTLDLVATLGIHPPKPEERKLAVLRTLSTQPWPIRIHGKLGRPQIDASPLGDAGFDLLGRTLDDIQSGKPSVGGRLFNSLNEAGLNLAPNDVAQLIELFRSQTSATSPAGPTPASPTLPPPSAPQAVVPPTTAEGIQTGVNLAVDVLEEIARRRRERLQGGPPPGEAEAPPTSGNSNSNAAPEPSPRRPLLRFGLNLLRDATAPTPTGTPPAAPPPPGPAPTKP